MKLYRFTVEHYDSDSDDWTEAGSVLLPFNAGRTHTEHALAAVGIYAPRGADELHWNHTARPDQYGEIYASGQLIVRLTSV
jgi:hypothetical protein